MGAENMMNRNKTYLLFLVAILLLAACNGTNTTEDDEDATKAENGSTAEAESASSSLDSTVVASASEGMNSLFEINEIIPGPDGYVALKNFTDVPVTLAGQYICQGKDCFELPGEIVSPDETVKITVGNGDGLDGLVIADATMGKLQPADGEIALFASTNWDNPAALLTYLEWGSTPHDLTELAIEAGLWLEGTYAPAGSGATRLFRVEETGLWIWEWDDTQ